MTKRVVKYILVFAVIPLLIVGGVMVFGNSSYSVISMLIAVIGCVPFFLTFEKRENNTRKIVILAVMTALSVAGRFIFAPLPFFKPVTAMVIISAMYFGSEFGFMVGSLSAVISNFYFGQGPWTPFQMFCWGIIGFLAGILSNQLLRSKIVLVLYGVFSGVIYSLIMDVWTTLWADGMFNISRFIASVSASLPIIGIYVVSNVIFLLILVPLFSKKIIRIKTKYGL
ncbi:MAG: ECF transporter S component [Ruminococcus sp.]